MKSVLDYFQLTGQVAIVTGGAGRLGSQLCDALAEAGAHVVVASRDLKRCQAKADEILSMGLPRPLAVRANVTQPDSVRQMAQTVMDEFGRIDVLVNNAYSATSKPFETMTAEEFESAMTGSVTSSFLCAQAVSKPMAAAKYGVIINVASIYGLVSPDHSVYGDTGLNSPCNYGASKAGLLQLTRWLATYLAPQGIRVNSLTPGGIYNVNNRERLGYEDVFVKNYCDRTPLGRLGNETDFKGAVLFLASPASAYVVGQNLVVDGGLTAW